jgi:hypothetical protein
MIDIDMELSSLLLALRLSKQVEKSRECGEDEFTLFRKIAGIIKEYERGRSNK